MALDPQYAAMVDNMIIPQLQSMPFTADELQDLFTYTAEKFLAEIARRRALEATATLAAGDDSGRAT